MLTSSQLNVGISKLSRTIYWKIVSKQRTRAEKRESNREQRRERQTKAKIENSKPHCAKNNHPYFQSSNEKYKTKEKIVSYVQPIFECTQKFLNKYMNTHTCKKWRRKIEEKSLVTINKIDPSNISYFFFWQRYTTQMDKWCERKRRRSSFLPLYATASFFRFWSEKKALEFGHTLSHSIFYRLE